MPLIYKVNGDLDCLDLPKPIGRQRKAHKAIELDDTNPDDKKIIEPKENNDAS